MINAIGAGAASSLQQTEQQLFAAIDTNGDGNISQGELSGFLSQLRAARGASAAGGASAASVAQTVNASALYGALDTSGGNGVSLQDFESNIGSFAAAVRSQLAAAQGATAGSAAATAAGSGSSATSAGTAGVTSHHGHHGHHGGGGAQALAASLLQQLQSSGATAAAGTQATLDTTA